MPKEKTTLNALLLSSTAWRTDWKPQFALDLDRATPSDFSNAVEEFEAWAKTQPQDKLPLESGWYDVEPQLCELLLIRNSGNRKPSLATVKRYARYMQDGDWPRTGETIVVNDDGRAMNLQHRAWACLFGGASFPNYIVADGVSNDPQLFAYYDNGKTRTVSDVLRTAGFNGHATVMGKAVQIGHDYDIEAYAIAGKGLKRLKMPTLTKVQIIDFINSNPDLIAVATAVNSEGYRPGVTLVKHKEVATFVAYRQLQLYGEERMDEFWTGLSNPEQASAPVAQLHALLLKNLEASKKAQKSNAYAKRFNQMITLAFLIRASNAFVLGEDSFSENFKLHDHFPRFVEVDDATELEEDEQAEAAE
jgi:hypothetical protein